MVNNEILNGVVLEKRDKISNEHVKLLSDSTLECNELYEIYSVSGKDGKVYKIGDVVNSGYISDFFIHEKELYLRELILVKNSSSTEIKMKKYCKKL